MASVYLSGILTAWCLTQLALGVFFAGAYFALRRERDLLIFAAVCLVLAFHSASSAHAQTAFDLVGRKQAITAVISAALLAAALNLHFVLAFLEVAKRRRLITICYIATGAFEVVNLLDGWWVSGSERLVAGRVLGSELLNWHAHPTLLGTLGFGLTGIELAISAILLARGWRAGKSEAGYALAGAVAVLAAAGNDIVLASGLREDALFMVPHAFMLYAFGVTAMLVVRQRFTLEALVRAESNLRQATEELRVSHAELEEVQNELSSKQQLAAVGELAAAIAHEVRNPLAVIGNAVAGLRRAQTKAEEHEVLLGIVQEEAERLNQLVTDLLRFARPSKLKRAPVDVPELIEAACASVLVERQYDVALDDRAPTEVDADANLLRLALDNVLQNACQATSAGGKIEIRLSPDELEEHACLRLDVRDHGSGMSDATRARALDPFFTTRPSGTGLGLPIVKRVLEAHGGKVSLESRQGEGTTVSLWIPLRALPPASSRPPSGREKQLAGVGGPVA